MFNKRKQLIFKLRVRVENAPMKFRILTSCLLFNSNGWYLNSFSWILSQLGRAVSFLYQALVPFIYKQFKISHSFLHSLTWDFNDIVNYQILGLLFIFVSLDESPTKTNLCTCVAVKGPTRWPQHLWLVRHFIQVTNKVNFKVRSSLGVWVISSLP